MSTWREGRQATAFGYALPPDAHKTLVQTSEQLEQMLRRLADSDITFFDFETTGLRWSQGSRGCGLALGRFIGPDGPEVDAWYVPYRHRTLARQLDYDIISPALRDVLGDPLCTKAAHNCTFDSAMARIEGWPLRGPRFCTLVAANLHDEHQPLGLKHRAKSDLNDPSGLVYDQRIDYHVARQAKLYGAGLREYKARLGYSEVPVDICGRYACWDIAYCAGLYHKYMRQERMGERCPRVLGNEMALIEVIEDMERVGLAVDADYLVDLQATLGQARTALEAKIWSALPGVRPFELSQDDSMRRLLVDHLHLPLTKRTKDKSADKMSVDREVLKAFVDKAPVLAHIIDWRDAQKLLTTYTVSLLDRLDDQGVVHPSFKAAGTSTGRMSCEAPNLQNMPGDSKTRAKQASGRELKNGGVDPFSIRRAFVVPKGYVRLFFDYSQIELRVLTHYTQDAILLDSYVKGEDVHARTTREVFGRDDEDLRGLAKLINFGIIFGLSSRGLAREVGISDANADEYLKRYLEKYAAVDPYRKAFWRRTRRNGGRFVNAWGRPQRALCLDSKNPYERASAERRSFAALIQGTAAELTKESLVRLWRHLQNVGSGARIVNVIHDEIQIDCPREEVVSLLPWVRFHMQTYPEFAPIPILVDGRMVERHWAEAYAHTAKLPGFM